MMKAKLNPDATNLTRVILMLIEAEISLKFILKENTRAILSQQTKPGLILAVRK